MSGDFVWAWISIFSIITNYVVFSVTLGSLKSSFRFQAAIISYQRVTVSSVILCVDHGRISLFSWRTPIDLSPYSGLRHEDLTPSCSAVLALSKAFCADSPYKTGPVNTVLSMIRFVSRTICRRWSIVSRSERLCNSRQIIFFVRRSQGMEIMKSCFCLRNGEAD